MMQVKEEEEYLEWLKGQRQTLSKYKSIATELVSFWRVVHSLNESSHCCHDVHLSVHLSVCLSWMGMHCDHTVHPSVDLSLQLDGPVFWAP